MSYSTELKQQLAEREIKKNCCRRSLVYGMLQMRAGVTGDEIALSLPAEAVAPLAALEIRRALGCEAKVRSIRARFPRTELIFSSGQVASQLVTGELSYPQKTPACPHCQAHFLRGIFLAVGRMSDFKKLYRLEFAANERADALQTLLAELGIPPRRTVRRTETILYYKTNSEICDFLAVIGAEAAAFGLINDNIEAGYRNIANRRANCEARNIERAVEASMRFVHIYRRLVAADKLSCLPEELRETAILRAENPSVPLGVLGAKHSPPISKSGMNHRLEKIERLAEELLKNEEE